MYVCTYVCMYVCKLRKLEPLSSTSFLGPKLAARFPHLLKRSEPDSPAVYSHSVQCIRTSSSSRAADADVAAAAAEHHLTKDGDNKSGF